jgi:hypothetical protein
VHVFEDGEPGHQPGWQRRLPRPVIVDGSETLFEKAPIDCCGELRQRMVHIDDLVKPGLE